MLPPCGVESVYPVASVHMSGQSAGRERPVLLAAQYRWSSDLAKIVLALVVFLQEQHRHDRRFVVSDVTFFVCGVIGIDAICIDARNPIRIILRFACWKI